MGGPLHRRAPLRQSAGALIRKPLLLLSGGLGLAVLAGLVLLSQGRRTTPVPEPEPAVRAPEAVAALGQLEPAGDVRRLAAPVSGFGGTPRIASLLVEEGQTVRKGQVLARFDNQPQIKADLAEVDARLRTLSAEISMQTRAVQRYATAAQVGAAALVVLDDERDELMRRQGERREAVARRRGLLADLADSELRSPINGLVLRVHAREGERPGAEGVIEVGATQAMEALIEVYESDVGRIGVGQTVTLVSENGGLDGSLSGEVIAISPQVRQRAVLSTDPTGDADARIVEVRVKLDAASASRVQALSGMKVIARFKPL